MRRLRLLGAWLVVLVLTTAVTWQIVNAAEDQINTDVPPIAVEASQADPATSSTAQTSEEPTTSSPSSGSQPAPTATTSESSDTSSASSTSSTTRAQESAWTLRTIDSTGGTVVVRYRPGEVELQAATPAPGFQAEVDSAGPPDVRVEFESEDVDVRIEAKWDDGGLEVKISS